MHTVRSLWFTALTACLALTAPVLRADDTPLGKSMEAINASYKDLRKALRSPDVAQKPDYLKLVAAIRAEAVKSKELVPQKIEELSGAEKDTELAAYKKAMDDFIGSLDELAKLISSEKWDEVNTAVRNLNSQKGDGHDRFQKQE